MRPVVISQRPASADEIVWSEEMVEIRTDDWLPTALPPGRQVLLAGPHDPLQLAALGPTWLDVAPAACEQVRAAHPGIKLLVSLHLDATPDEALVHELMALPCDAVKLVTRPTTALDAIRLLQFHQKCWPKPLIAFAMGERFSWSRIVAAVLGSAWSYACLPGRPTAPGQLPAAAYEAIGLSTALYGLIGDPLHKSPSHVTHNALFRHWGIDACYLKVPLDAHEAAAIPQLQALGFRGLSVTTPLKQACGGNTCYTGGVANTDGVAAADHLATHGALDGVRAAIVGAGATAKAIAQELLERGVQVHIASRTPEKAEALARELGCAHGLPAACDLAINATSSAEVVLPLAPHVLHVGLESPSGLQMWARQAAKQMALWGHAREEEALRLLQPAIIWPGALHGTIALPPSKSHTLRALLCATYAEGVSTIRGALASRDTDAMVAICRGLGAGITLEDGCLHVRGRQQLAARRFDAGGSGIALRFGAALSALDGEEVTWDGDHSLQQLRPSGALWDGLQQLGARVQSQHGYAPCTIQGPIRPGDVVVHGTDSQPVSALMFACGRLPGVSRIRVVQPGELPWLEVTRQWLARVGVEVEVAPDWTQIVVHGREVWRPFDYTVPGDLTAMAYPLVAALTTPSDCRIANADLSDVQGDKVLLDLLQAMGARVTYEGRALHVQGPQQLVGMECDVSGCIDTITALAVVGCHAMGRTTICNGAMARHKESDRVAAMACELRRMGAAIEERADGLVVRQSALRGTHVMGHDDHRVAMALACAALAAEGPTRLYGVGCVGKSYPGFFDAWRGCGTMC